MRPELPPALATLVMQCLEKDEAKRPQSANEVLQVLDAIGTPSGGGHDVRPAIATVDEQSLVRALAIWLVATAAVATVAKAAVIAIGLPTWTFPGAMLVMATRTPGDPLHVLREARGARRADDGRASRPGAQRRRNRRSLGSRCGRVRSCPGDARGWAARSRSARSCCSWPATWR